MGGYNLQGKPLKKSADKGKKSTAKGKKSAAKGKPGVNAKAAAEKKKIDSAAKKAGVLQAKRKRKAAEMKAAVKKAKGQVKKAQKKERKATKNLEKSIAQKMTKGKKKIKKKTEAAKVKAAASAKKAQKAKAAKARDPVNQVKKAVAKDLGKVKTKRKKKVMAVHNKAAVAKTSLKKNAGRAARLSQEIAGAKSDKDKKALKTRLEVANAKEQQALRTVLVRRQKKANESLLKQDRRAETASKKYNFMMTKERKLKKGQSQLQWNFQRRKIHLEHTNVINKHAFEAADKEYNRIKNLGTKYGWERWVDPGQPSWGSYADAKKWLTKKQTQALAKRNKMEKLYKASSRKVAEIVKAMSVKAAEKAVSQRKKLKKLKEAEKKESAREKLLAKQKKSPDAVLQKDFDADLAKLAAKKINMKLRKAESQKPSANYWDRVAQYLAVK